MRNRGSMDSWGDDFTNRPRRTIMRVIGWIFVIGIVFSSLSYALGWFSEAAQVAKEEFGAKASLEKYEWFKDCSFTIEEKQHTIKMYETNVVDMDSSYNGVSRRDWDRLDKQQYNQWRMEITGLKASYNKVVREYNSASSKFNWTMYNTANLPDHYDEYMDN